MILWHSQSIWVSRIRTKMMTIKLGQTYWFLDCCFYFFMGCNSLKIGMSIQPHSLVGTGCQRQCARSCKVCEGSRRKCFSEGQGERIKRRHPSSSTTAWPHKDLPSTTPQTNWRIIFQVGGDKKRYSSLSLNLNRSETSTTGASISTRDPGWGWMNSFWNSCWELNIWPCLKIGGESKDNSWLQCSMISSYFIPNCKHRNALFFCY